MMRLITYMTKPHKSDGHWTWWRDAVSIALANEVGQLLGAEVEFGILPTGGGRFFPDHSRYDLGFLPFGWYPASERPIADWVYTFASDVQGYESKMLKWMDAVRPDFIGCLQDMPEWMIDWGMDNDCVVGMFPWWTIEPPPAMRTCAKDIQVFCSGAVGRSYPMRTKAATWLSQSKDAVRGRVRMSIGPFGKYPMDRQGYLDTLLRCRYYLTAGIHDRLVPPKYTEVAGYGCTIVTPDMPWLTDMGFVDGETCVTYKSTDDLADTLNSDKWIGISAQAHHLAYSQHTTAHRAELLKQYFCERMET